MKCFFVNWRGGSKIECVSSLQLSSTKDGISLKEQIRLNVVVENVFEDDKMLFAKSQSAWVFTHALAISL
jgi:hypothetical protein